ncbi:MAG: ATP-binding protein, partial [Lactobacillaceae bacterium]
MTFRDKNLEVDNISSLNIQIIPDANSKTLTIKDNGIGMRKIDLINDIGSIASSGTRKFKEELEKSQGDKTQLGNLIGQFGLGFYSSFLVAEKVDIVTRHPEDEAYIWSSYGKDSYTIEKYEGESFNHGTSIILYLKEGMEEFLESKKIISLVKKHSQFVGIPIYTFEEKEVDDVKEEKAIEEIKDENKTDENKDKEENEEPVVEEPVVEEETKEVKKKKIIEKVKINN